MAACFNMLAINLVVRREMGLLKRLRLSPLPTWAMLAAVSASALIISVAQVTLVLLIGGSGYNVPFPHNIAHSSLPWSWERSRSLVSGWA